MPSFQRLVVASLVALVVLVAAAYWVRRYLSNATETNEQSQEERVEYQAEMTDYSLPLRSKWGQLQRPTQVILFGVMMLIAVLGYETYTFAKTGSPTQIWYAQTTQLAIAGGIATVAGIVFDRKRASSEGEAHVKFEDEEDGIQSTKTIPFSLDDVVETEDGTIIHEYSQNRVFGLYRRAKAIVEDRRLREEAAYRPVDDKIAHLVPENATWLDDQTVEWKTKGEVTKDAEGKAYDYRYQPPFTKSRKEYRKVQNEKEMLRDKNRELRIRIGNIQQSMNTLEQDLKRAREMNFEEVIEQVAEIQDIVGSSRHQTVLNKDKSNGRSSRDEDVDTDAIAAGDPSENGRSKGGRS